MKQLFIRFSRLIFGLFLYSLGIVVTMKANIGYAPWDVFHAGFAKITGLNIGNISIIVGILIGVMTILLGEKIGIGTLLNMVLIGVFLDILLAIRVIPEASNFIPGVLMVIAGLFIIALASYFYISSAFGTGPRDSLMVALTRITGLPIGICRGTIELMAVLAGWSLGGMVGLGTVISAFVIGFCVQITFKLLKFDATKIRHETLDVTCSRLFNKKEGSPEEKDAAEG